MSGLTGSDAKGLMEAYQAVYAPKQLTEEQVWEEVENWVNSLLEEGYDLSDYTWEEMYENYIQLDEQFVQAAQLAAPYVLPALGLGAATYGAKGLMNGNGVKNTPEEERWLSTGSFASSKETPSEQKARIENARAQREKIAKEKAERTAQTTSVPGESVRGPKGEKPGPSGKPPTETPPSGVNPPTPPGPPKGPNKFQQFVSNKWKEFRGAVGRGGKDAEGRGMTDAAGEVLGSLIRTPVRQTLDVGRKALSPLIAPAGGAYAAYKGIKDVMDPKTWAGRFVRGIGEDYEITDLISHHLIESGYAKDKKSALPIMENMSEKWFTNILENYLEE